MGWAGLSNGTLLRRAAESFDAFITVDRNLSFQQNHRDLQIAVVVLVARSNEFETLRLLIPDVLRVLPLLHKGQVVRVGPA